LHIEAAVFEVTGDKIAHVAVVFDQQDAGLHRGAGEGRPGEGVSGRAVDAVSVRALLAVSGLIAGNPGV
jgi:hypothetical protein